MDEALAKIRPHKSSSLTHQKIPATLLVALEATFREQKTETSPTAYFAALLTTLDGTLQKNELGLDEADVLPAELYLLALVAPFVPTPVIRANLSTVLSLTSPLFPALISHAPALRSQLSLYHVIFQSVDRTQLEAQGIRQTFASILQLCIDPRPKVRKKAADVVKDVLADSPTPLLRHPYAERVAEWVKSSLSEVNAAPLSRPKGGKSAENPGSETAIHILAFLRPVLSLLPPTSLPSITTSLLSLPRLGNPYLSQSAYSILSDLFALPDEDGTSIVGEQISDVLKVVLSSLPSKSNATLAPAWVNVLGNAMLAYNLTNADACAVELGKVWKSVWNFLESTDAPTRKASAQSLDLLSRCLTPTLISSALQDADSRSTLGKIVAQVTKALDSLAYARAIPELLSVVSSLISNLRHRHASRSSPTAAESLLLPLIKKVGELRTQKGFEHKEGADATLATAMRVLGPQVMLQVLPLNLEPADRQAGLEPRAYLLPLLTQPHSSPLGHFVSYFVPMSERMFDLQQKAEAEGRQSEAKVWSVLVAQVWSGLAGYCYAPADLKEALNPSFSQLLSQLLYGQPELRPAVLKALKVLIDSNVSLTLPGDDKATDSGAISAQEASENIAFLRTQAESWLAVLFNVFGSVNRDGRGMVGDVIAAWASIAGEQEIAKAYIKVIDLFKNNMINAHNALHGNNDAGSATATTQDILILLLANLSPSDATGLFQLCLSTEVLSGKDNGVQKRGYKILTKLVESGKVVVDAETVLKQLDDLMDGLAPAAKKDRFNLISLLIPRLPSSAMHVIPSLIPEAVLGTKEPSEKARTAAFDMVLTMGRKMSEGGVVRRSMVDGMDEGEDGAGTRDAVANVEEFVTMIAGGLAGASPHMISATVTAISRLVFEFKDTISPKMHTEIFTTLLVFLSSANREIVKSILGFVKLTIHTLPADLIRPHLKELVPALLAWSHDHKNHFKAKVRHIFERMIRRFGWDDVYACAGEEEAAKVLVNIKKRKERAKRKRANKEDDEDELPSNKLVVGDAFEDVLYGSESELDSDDNEGPVARNTGHSKKKSIDHGARLRVDDDEPMDLLQGAASRITNTSNRRRKPGQDASYFKMDESNGKMVIDDEVDSDSETTSATTRDPAGSAYLESMTSVDGFTRGPNGRVKFNKDTKKRRRENDEIEDVEMGDAAGQVRKTKRKSDVKLGHEFKAKKAGGDVKKNGMDPYAYMTLSQASKKTGKIGIAGKR